MCSARQTLEIIFHWFLTSFFCFYNCTQLFSLGSVEAAPNRETRTNFHHKTLVYFLLCFTSEPPEKSIFCCSGNYAKLPVRQNTVLPRKKAASWCLCSATHVSPSDWRSCRRRTTLHEEPPRFASCLDTTSAGTVVANIRSSSGPKFNLDHQQEGSHTHAQTLRGMIRT